MTTYKLFLPFALATRPTSHSIPLKLLFSEFKLIFSSPPTNKKFLHWSSLTYQPLSTPLTMEFYSIGFAQPVVSQALRYPFLPPTSLIAPSMSLLAAVPRKKLLLPLEFLKVLFLVLFFSLSIL